MYFKSWTKNPELPGESVTRASVTVWYRVRLHTGYCAGYSTFVYPVKVGLSASAPQPLPYGYIPVYRYSPTKLKLKLLHPRTIDSMATLAGAQAGRCRRALARLAGDSPRLQGVIRDYLEGDARAPRRLRRRSWPTCSSRGQRATLRGLLAEIGEIMVLEGQQTAAAVREVLATRWARTPPGTGMWVRQAMIAAASASSCSRETFEVYAWTAW